MWKYRWTRVRSPPPPLTPESQPGSKQKRLVSTNWRAFLFYPTYREFLTLWRSLGCDRRRTHPTRNRHQKGSNGPKGSKSRDTPPSCPVTETSQKQGRNELAKNGVLRRNASSNMAKNPCPVGISGTVPGVHCPTLLVSGALTLKPGCLPGGMPTAKMPLRSVVKLPFGFSNLFVL